MKKYKLKHDSILLSIPTMPTNDCNQITDSGMGAGKGQILYGIPAQRKRMGHGMQNFIHISSPTHISGKEVLGMYVPANAVQELPTVKSESMSSADGDVPKRKLASAKNLRGLGAGFLIGATVVYLSKDKAKALPYLYVAGGVVMFASLFFEE
jgi:hypothetical protein